MYKIKNNLSPIPMREIFTDCINHYDFRNEKCWELSKARTVFYGTETIRCRGPKTWDLLPQHIRDSKTLSEFKNKVKTWKPLGCTCRLCKTFIPELGFIN